jgi:hypothetical protein
MEESMLEPNQGSMQKILLLNLGLFRNQATWDWCIASLSIQMTITGRAPW